MFNKSIKTEMDKFREVPCRIYDFLEGFDSTDYRKIADLILEKFVPDLEINPDLAHLKYEQVKESLSGTHVFYQQYLYGQPISGAWIRIDFNNQGKAFNIMNELFPEKILKGKNEKECTPTISSEDAADYAYSAIPHINKTKIEFKKSELVYFSQNGMPRIAWKLLLKLTNPSKEWKIYVCAQTGQVFAKVDLLRHVNGTGKIFDPNPIAKLNDFTLNNSSKISPLAYDNVILFDLDNSGMLNGPFVTTKLTSNRILNADFKFNFTRTDNPFKEVMAYYHIDAVQRYLQFLGFKKHLNQPIEVNTEGSESESSFYSSISKTITFGKKEVDDAEDGEIIVHEYAHALLDYLVPGFGENNDQASAMGEGFCDYLAASFFADKKPDLLKPTFGNWNAAVVGAGNPPFMRRLDSIKKFPADFTRNAHADGEIWSACLWNIRKNLGKEMADRLIIEHLSFLKRDDKFETAANYMIVADKQLYQGIHETIIKNIFKEKGILL